MVIDWISYFCWFIVVCFWLYIFEVIGDVILFFWGCDILIVVVKIIVNEGNSKLED